MIAGAASILSDAIGYILIAVLSLTGILFCFKTKFVQFRMFKEACRLTLSNKKNTDAGKKQISSFQAFCVSLGCRVGVGNITGVCLALLIGGPGAIFWMWLFAIIGSATSFVETTLGQIFKEKSADGIYVGGPAYNARNALGRPKLGIILAVVAIACHGFCISGTFGNTIVSSLSDAFNIPQLAGAILLIIVLGIILFAGFRGVAKVSVWLVPLMAVAYLLLAFVTIAMNISAVPEIFASIFAGAFDLSAGLGGLLGSTVLVGVQRGLFSNQAGDGAITMLTSSADVSHPVKQGLMQSLGVFIDTLVICSATAFMVMVFGNPAGTGFTVDTLLSGILGEGALGAAAPYVIAAFILIFSFTSIIATTSIGEQNLKFFTGKKLPMIILKCGLLCFVFVTSLQSFDIVWKINDCAIGLHTIANCVLLFLLGKYAIEALADYQKQKKAGVKEPEFDPKCLSSKRGITAWPRKKE
ncbi:MAG TPA: alanine/glycine:cation symporter family protein [Methanocorpusculum sp.]|nr:alanine/glycine:cation symporter family protein [Methanocorpusculum sp.]